MVAIDLLDRYVMPSPKCPCESPSRKITVAFLGIIVMSIALSLSRRALRRYLYPVVAGGFKMGLMRNRLFLSSLVAVVPPIGFTNDVFVSDSLVLGKERPPLD